MPARKRAEKVPEGVPGRLDPSSWPALTVELRPIADLMPYAKNAMRHGAVQLDLLKKSISTYGVTMPALMDDGGTLIAGHGRIMAAAELGLERFPVAVALGWDEARVRAYRLADNQLARLGTWDAELLGGELGALQALACPLEDLGFATHELDAFLGDFEGPSGAFAPEEFGSRDETPETEHECPRCGRRWSDGAKPAGWPGRGKKRAPPGP